MISPLVILPTRLPLTPDSLNRWRRFGTATALLTLGFCIPLYQVTRFALRSDLYSHVILIPLVSAYLIWIRRAQLAEQGRALNPVWGIAAAIAGVGLAAVYLALPRSSPAEMQNAVATAMYSFVTLIGAAALLLLGRQTLKVMAFPLVFLVFLAPFPLPLEESFEAFLQQYSALAAHGLFEATGMPVFRDGTYFRLPGFSMHVAPECSGIHSTIALFLTSLVGGQLLLRSPWRRAILVAVVLPIALARNGLRVFVIGELCVRIGPEMIDSYIHHHGGPIFFALSLIPFSLVLVWLIRADRRARPDSTSPVLK
jgi:exosortase C (VPDSG-CTERM-specific)